MVTVHKVSTGFRVQRVEVEMGTCMRARKSVCFRLSFGGGKWGVGEAKEAVCGPLWVERSGSSCTRFERDLANAEA